MKTAFCFINSFLNILPIPPFNVIFFNMKAYSMYSYRHKSQSYMVLPLALRFKLVSVNKTKELTLSDNIKRFNRKQTFRTFFKILIPLIH
jgi:hypothetical protein